MTHENVHSDVVHSEGTIPETAPRARPRFETRTPPQPPSGHNGGMERLPEGGRLGVAVGKDLVDLYLVDQNLVQEPDMRYVHELQRCVDTV